VKYRPEIDGLRAVSVIPVILFHASIPFFDGGFIGVDIFFVISGYLITSIILKELDAGTFSLSNFYERRARRILPALFTVIAITLPAAWVIMNPQLFAGFSKSMTATGLFASNFHFKETINYFLPIAELSPLLHTWSLAIEEQFYVIFPLILMACWRFMRRAIPIILVLIFIGSLALAEQNGVSHPKSAFYLLQYRAWELTLGALCGLYILRYRPDNHKTDGVFQEALPLLGLVLIAFSIYAFKKTGNGLGYLMLIPNIGVVLIILFASSHTLAGKILSLPILVRLGLISYSAYLWHHPIFALTRLLHIEAPGIPLMLALSLIFNADIGNYTSNNEKLHKQSWAALFDRFGKDYYVTNNQADLTLWFNEKDPRQKILVIGNSLSVDMYITLNNSKTVSEKFEVARFGLNIKNLKQELHPLFSSPNYKNSDIIFIATRFSDQDINSLSDVLERLQRDQKRIILSQGIFEFPTYRNGLWSLVDKEVHAHYQPGMSAKAMSAIINKSAFKIYQTTQNINGVDLEKNKAISKIVHSYPNVKLVNPMDYICNRRLQSCLMTSETMTKHITDWGHLTLYGAAIYGQKIDQIGWLNNIDLAEEKPKN